MTTSYRSPAVAASLGAALISLVVAAGANAAEPAVAPRASGAALVGGALPGGAVISARSVAVAPAAGGTITAVPVAGDGTFRVTGLAPGAYRLALTSTAVAKQTQGATFGEKVNAGLHAAGSAVAQGASAKSGINGINANSMPNRISMNVTVAKVVQPVVVDETAVAVEVGADGVLAGRVDAP